MDVNTIYKAVNTKNRQQAKIWGGGGGDKNKKKHKEANTSRK